MNAILCTITREAKLKQFQFEVQNTGTLCQELEQIRNFCANNTHSSVSFQIFTQLTDTKELQQITDKIEEALPDAYWYGMQTYGNILNGTFTGGKTVITASVFESADTKTGYFLIDGSDPDADFADLEGLWAYCNKNKWIKAVELAASYSGAEKLGVDKPISNLRNDVQVFGGIAINPLNAQDSVTCVFSKNHGTSTTSIIAAAVGGPNLHCQTSYILGWEGLGKSFTVTDCEDTLIRGIDGHPAISIYKNYLNVEEDSDFMTNATFFPLLIERNGVESIRIPFATSNGQDIRLVSKVENGMKIRLSYGDKTTILNHVRSRVKEMAAFTPDGIRCYSCAIRKNFWGNEKVSQETEMFQRLAPADGCYTRGEIIRIGNYLHCMNATIVSCLIREGDTRTLTNTLDDVRELKQDATSLAPKLINYIEAVSGELEGQFNRTLLGLSKIYRSMFLIDAENKTLIQLDNDKRVREILAERSGFWTKMKHLVEKLITEDKLEEALRFCNLNTLSKRLAKKDFIDCELTSRSIGWFRAQFIVINRNRDGRPSQYVFTVQEIDSQKRLAQEREKIIRTLANTYFTVHLFDLEEDTSQEMSSQEVIHTIYEEHKKTGNQNTIHSAMKAVCHREFLEQMLEFTDFSTLPERMKNRQMISAEFDGLIAGWAKASFIVYERDKSDKLTKVLFVTQIIEDEKEKEQKLLNYSITDELTGLWNRRAYENDLKELEKRSDSHEFVFVALDVNSLKSTNDEIGHSAGDELIKGAAECITLALGSYGKIYRTGGDEFAAILKISEHEIEKLRDLLDLATQKWHGFLVKKLSLAIGFASVAECGGDIGLVVRKADQRMYENKELFYRTKGVDRRKNRGAFEIICDSYIKILRINLSDDSFDIIKTNSTELSESKGFHTESISQWLYSFAVSGQVHPEDREHYIERTNLEFLRKFFAEENRSYALHYRRAIGNDFRHVLMEMIPTKSFTEDNQELFLYVKDINV